MNFQLFLEIEFGMCYSWFSHDVTKIQTFSFYFHLVLEHLKTFMQTNSQSKMVLRFAIQDALISRLLRDAAFSWRPGKFLCGLKTLRIFKHNYYVNLNEFLNRRVHALVRKLKTRCFCWFPAAIFVPLKRTQAWRPQTKLYKFGQNVFPNISHMKYCTDVISGKAFCIFKSGLSYCI